MKINLEELENINNEFQVIIDNYETSYLNLYNNLNINELIDTTNTQRILQNLEEQKKESQEILNELTDIKGIYTFIEKKYQEIGKKIQIDISTKDEILNNFNNYINEINKTVSLYNNLIASSNKKVVIKLQKQKAILLYQKKSVKSLKKSIKEIFINIEENEKTNK